MTILYHVWNPDDGETRETATPYEAVDADMAVKLHAEFEYSECDGWEWMPKSPPTYRCEGDGKTVDIEITVDFEPYFYSGTPRPVVDTDPSAEASAKAEAPAGSEGG